MHTNAQPLMETLQYNIRVKLENSENECEHGDSANLFENAKHGDVFKAHLGRQAFVCFQSCSPMFSNLYLLRRPFCSLVL